MIRDDKKKPGATPEPSSTSVRWHSASGGPDDIVSVRLIRKYAEHLDDVNLENVMVGDRLDLSPRDAYMLIAEGWAVHVDDERLARMLPRALAADSSRRSRKKPGKS